MKKKKYILWAVFGGLALVLLLMIGTHAGVSHYFSKLNYVARDSASPVLPAAETPALTGESELQERQLADEALQSQQLDRLVGQTQGVMNILLIGVDNDYLPGLGNLGNADGLLY